MEVIFQEEIATFFRVQQSFKDQVGAEKRSPDIDLDDPEKNIGIQNDAKTLDVNECTSSQSIGTDQDSSQWSNSNQESSQDWIESQTTQELLVLETSKSRQKIELDGH